MADEYEITFPILWENEEDKKETWSRQQIADRYPDPATPLFGDIWFSNVGPAIKRMGDFLNILKPGFVPRYAIFNGYAYGNLDPKNMSIPRLILLMFQLYRKADQVEKKYEIDMEVPHLNKVKELGNQDITNFTETELNTHLSILEKTFEDWMVTQNITFFFTEYGIKIFGIFTKLLFGRTDSNLYLTLTSGFDNASIVMTREIAKMASLVQDDKKRELFEKYSGVELWEKIKSDPTMNNFVVEFKKFIDEHGYRTTHWDFVYPTWKEAPEITLDIIKSFVLGSATLEDQLKEQEQERLNAEKTVKTKLDSHLLNKPFRKQYLKWMDLAQRYTILKERRQINMYKVWVPIRQTVIEIGNRLLNNSIIEDISDTFFLRRSELSYILIAISNNEVDENWIGDYQKLIQERRHTWNNQFEMEPPIEIKWQKSADKKITLETKGLFGTPASAGEITARANIVLIPQELGKFKKGDILVTKYTNPSWTPLFGIASGVITEAGGMLSHAAIVAREYGIPAIVGLHNATKLINDQETITLNGNTGTVTKT